MSANTSGMAGRYAKAIFELARENGDLDQVERDLATVQTALNESDALKKLTTSPLFSVGDQLNGLNAVFGRAGFSRTTSNSIALIVKNRRLFALDRIIKTFFSIVSESRGEVGAEVTSAAPLDGGQLEKVRDAVKAAVGQDVQLDTKVDPTIIGGLIVKVGSRMIDNSIRTKLNKLKIAMKEVG